MRGSQHIEHHQLARVGDLAGVRRKLDSAHSSLTSTKGAGRKAFAENGSRLGPRGSPRIYQAVAANITGKRSPAKFKGVGRRMSAETGMARELPVILHTPFGLRVNEHNCSAES